MENNKSEKGSFWTTFPGAITAIAAVITAVAGLLTVLHPPKSETPPPATTTSQIIVLPQATSIEVAVLKPSPAGIWTVIANSQAGTLNMRINSGRISGTIYDDSIDGTWDAETQQVTFKRNNNPDPTIFQIFTGTLIQQGNRYMLVGTFEDHDASGNVGTYDWSAER